MNLLLQLLLVVVSTSYFTRWNKLWLKFQKSLTPPCRRDMMNISSTSQRSTNQQSLHNTNSYTSYTYFHNKMCLANFGVKYPNPPSLVEGLGSLEFRWVASQTLRGFRNQCWNPKGFFQWPKGPPFAPNHYCIPLGLGPWHVGVVSNAIP